MIDDWKFIFNNDLPEIAAHIDMLDNCGNLHRTYFDPKKSSKLPSNIIAWKYVWTDEIKENMTFSMISNIKQRAKEFYEFTKKLCEDKKSHYIKNKFCIGFQEGKCYEINYKIGKTICWVYFKYSNYNVKGISKNGKDYLKIKNAIYVKDSDKMVSYQIKTDHFIDSEISTITKKIPITKMKSIIKDVETYLDDIKGSLDETTE